eukprot:Gb_29342 [translate_table: standard]
MMKEVLNFYYIFLLYRSEIGRLARTENIVGTENETVVKKEKETVNPETEKETRVMTGTVKGDVNVPGNMTARVAGGLPHAREKSQGNVQEIETETGPTIIGDMMGMVGIELLQFSFIS